MSDVNRDNKRTRPIQMGLGEALRRTRKRKAHSLTTAALHIGTRAATLFYWESGTLPRAVWMVHVRKVWSAQHEAQSLGKRLIGYKNGPKP
jgi:hypothetical protein